MKKDNTHTWEIEESFLSDDTPLLQNYYGDSFKYKKNFGDEELKNKIHSKKLNLEKNIIKQKLIKKEAKNNFIKLRIKLKTELKENIKNKKLSTKTDVRTIDETIYSLKNYIAIDDFLLSKIKNLSKDLKSKAKTAKKPLNL